MAAHLVTLTRKVKTPSSFSTTLRTHYACACTHTRPHSPALARTRTQPFSVQLHCLIQIVFLTVSTLAAGPDPGWTCLMYGDARTKWCEGGKVCTGSACSARYNNPSENCCVCGKGRPQPHPPPPPAPPAPPSPDRMDVCGGACQNGMVLQRGNARLWGLNGKAAETVTVKVDDATVGTTVADADGKWVVNFQPDAGWNHTVAVSGSTSGRTTTLSPVHFGDVILCSGQSNMELPAGPVCQDNSVTPFLLRICSRALSRGGQRSRPSVMSRCGGLQPSFSADVRSPDDVIAF